MSMIKNLARLFCTIFVWGTLFVTPTFSAVLDWDPARMHEVQVTKNGALYYPGQGGGMIRANTIPEAWQKGGAMRESLLAQQAPVTTSATTTGATASTPTTTSSTASTASARATASTPATSAATAKAPKQLPLGEITSSKGNVFTRDIIKHTDGKQYYREVHKSGIVNYKNMNGKFVSGKGFNNTPPPKTDPIKTNSKLNILKGTAGKVVSKGLGVLSIVGGAKMWWDANMGEGARTGKDLLMSTAGGAMVGMGVASVLALSGPAGWIALGAGAVVGAATVGWQMFSETDCLTDPVTNKQTCCNTTTGDVKRGIGDYMFCQKKGGGAMAMVRQCQVGGRSESGSGFWGWATDLFSDDAWSDDCEARWCSGTSAPPNGLGDSVRYVPDTSKVCWKWDCGESFNYDSKTKKCTPKYCDGKGPNEEEKDLPIYIFGLNEEKKCIEWGCIDGYQLMADYCAEIIPETTPAPTEQQTTPQPEPAPLEPDLGPDMYEYAIAKIEAQLAEMDAECGVGGKGNNEDTEVLDAVKGAKDMKEASKKLGTVKKFAERAGAAVGKSIDDVDAADDAAKTSKQFSLKEWTTKLFKKSDTNDKTDSNPNNNKKVN